ncbi:hypothetical protein G3I40_05185 [Streptomyces sp. SID14478]|uniref:hypothetical protein n=1 Tax=Streptomyces sp. SID14478 TaxID=2706073 RepID=UPI0013DAA021|nr:hypothetical protein [Streptomyces sp. SID14478]NEB74629.1 hypothetical protein [Streptomyces sp. SID14478]
MAGEQQHVWWDAGLALASAMTLWGLGWLTFLLIVRVQFMNGFASGKPGHVPAGTRDVILALVPAIITVAGPVALVWWGWQHQFWLTCAALLALPPVTGIWVYRRYDWRPFHRR